LIGTMAIMEWTLQIVLVMLLGATLLRAVRLERALGVLKRDRASLEALVVDFNASTHQAESGIQRLRVAADGTGRQIETQLSKSLSLKDDLAFLTERGDRLADRLELLVRSARPLVEEQNVEGQPRKAQADKNSETAKERGVSQIERDLLKALRMAR
jgi:hypothetical protein